MQSNVILRKYCREILHPKATTLPESEKQAIRADCRLVGVLSLVTRELVRKGRTVAWVASQRTNYFFLFLIYIVWDNGLVYKLICSYCASIYGIKCYIWAHKLVILSFQLHSICCRLWIHLDLLIFLLRTKPRSGTHVRSTGINKRIIGRCRVTAEKKQSYRLKSRDMVHVLIYTDGPLSWPVWSRERSVEMDRHMDHLEGYI